MKTKEIKSFYVLRAGPGQFLYSDILSIQPTIMSEQRIEEGKEQMKGQKQSNTQLKNCKIVMNSKSVCVLIYSDW